MSPEELPTPTSGQASITMFRRSSGATCKHWGYSFEWTPEHRTQEQLRPLIFSYDRLGSEALDRLENVSATKTRDLYALLEAHHAEDPVLQELWDQVTT